MLPRPKRLLPRGLIALLSVAIAFIVLYAALYSVYASPRTYAYQTQEQSARNARIISYLSGPLFSGSPPEFLSAAEASHMRDVKRLFDWAFLLDLAALGVVLGVLGVFAARKEWDHLEEALGRSLFWSGLGLFAFCALAGLSAILDFSKFWTLFHVFLFPQGNWMFPIDSALITLYPEEFFDRFALHTFGLLLIATVSMASLGLIIDRLGNAKKWFG